MSPNELSSYLIIGAILFCLGLFTVLTRRNAISVLMGVELILNSANINYVAFSHFSSGNAEVVATQKLNTNIAGSGDVKYWGDASVDSKVRGSGSVSRQK